MKSEKVLSKDLPADLWPEILSRLPVKSLLCFRCVSKSWLSLINDPDFCRLHLKNFKSNRDETHLLVVEGKQRNCVLRSSDTFEAKSGVLHTLLEGQWYPQCYIDGLFVMRRNLAYGQTKLGFCEIKVWNPSIRKCLDIPPLPEIEGYANISVKEYEIGLGYHPLVKDYKYVKLISKEGDSLPPVVAIYTVGTRSWKIVPFQFQGCCNWDWWLYHTTVKPVYLQGRLYFLAIKLFEVMELISIDLSSEVFSYTSLPDCGYMNGYLNGTQPLALVDDGCTLAVFDFKQREGSLWVLDSATTESGPGCWSQRYSFCLEEPDFSYLKKNGDVLLWWGKRKTSFRLAAGEKFKDYCGMVSSYNPETKKEEMVLPKEGFERLCPTERASLYFYSCYFHTKYVSGYIESLNLLK